MKEFTDNSKEQVCEIDPKKFYDEFWTMTCFNCDCPNHSKSEMACGLKNVEISREGKCIYWNEMNKKKTKLIMEEEKKPEDNKINQDSSFAQLDSEFIRNLVGEAKKEGVPVSICF